MSTEQLHPVDVLAEEYLHRLRRGESVSLEEYTTRHPEFADEIRDLFPALELLERGKPREDEGILAGLDSNRSPLPLILGDYRIIREIGRGGMGVVYEAEQQSLGRHVAIKVLNASISQDTHSLLRFRREARCAARLHHTNIVPVYEISHDQGLHFYAMQFIHGHGLHEIIKQLGPQLPGRDSPGRDDGDVWNGALSLAMASSTAYYNAVAGIGLQVAEALAYAHEQGVLHRDIKPANLMMDVDGVVWLTDFGLAKEDTSVLTKTGDVVGTLKYMPPERFRGIADARGDVYSLGLTLYELLTLRASGDRERIVHPTLVGNGTSTFPHPRTIDPRIPKDLETIVVKATAVEPGRRYQTAEEMTHDLRCFRECLPIRARRATWATRTWLWCARNRLTATLSAAAMVLLFVASLGWAASHILRTERDEALQARASAQAAERVAQRAQESALAREHLARATSLRMSGMPNCRGPALDEIRQGVVRDRNRSLTAELRNEAIAVLTTVDSYGVVLPWSTLIPIDANSPASSEWSQSLASIIRRSALGHRIPYAFSPDYRFCAMIDVTASRLLVTDRMHNRIVLTHELVLDSEIESRSVSFLLEFSPAGDLLAIRRGWLLVLDVASGATVLERDEHVCYDASPDGRWLAVGHRDNVVERIDLFDPAAIRNISTPWRPLCVSFDSTSAKLAIGYGIRAPVVDVVESDSTQTITRLNIGDQGAEYFQWRADHNDLLVARGQKGSAELWDVDEQKRIITTATKQSFVYRCSVDPHHQFFTTSYWSGISQLWDLHSGELALALDRDFHPGWNADGTIMGSRQVMDGLELVMLVRQRVFRNLHDWRRRDAAAFPSMAMFSPDGRMVLARMGSGSSHVDGHLAFWDAASYRLLAALASRPTRALTLSSDGLTLWFTRHHDLFQVPIHDDGAAGLQVGPPIAHRKIPTGTNVALSSDGAHRAWIDDHHKLYAVSEPHHEATWGQDAEFPLPTVDPMLLTPQQFDIPSLHDMCLISPDGRWIVTGGWHSPETFLCDRLGVHPPRSIQLGSQTGFQFSPDSTQLITCRWDAYRFWDLETLQSQVTISRSDFQLPGRIAISQDGRLAALLLRPGAIDIVKLPAGETLFRLERPRRSSPTVLAFSPDASLLLDGQYSSTGSLFGIWDFRQLQSELAKVNLDLPELDLSVEAPSQPPISSLRLVGCDDLKVSLFIGDLTEEHARAHLERLESQYASNQDSAWETNQLAWNLLMAPEPLRDPSRAMELAQKAIQITPNRQTRGTLGVAHYRAGQFQHAIDILETNSEDASDEHRPLDLYFLAMSYAANGQPELGEHYLRLANAWRTLERDDPLQMSAESVEELHAIRSEAEATIHRYGTSAR